MSRRKKNRKLKKRILIIGEGKTEKIYFTDMKEQEETSFVIIPELGKKGRSDFANIFRKAEECAEFYEFVYCVLDLDVICNKFQTNSYDDKKNKLLKKNKNIKIIESHPCFEEWILLHFEYFAGSCEKCGTVKAKLENHMPNYKKSNSIYKKLKHNQSEAVKRALKIKEDLRKNISTGVCKNYSQHSFTDVYIPITELLKL